MKREPDVWTLDHDPDVWTLDQRPILSASLKGDPDEGVFQSSSGIVFERFERNGHMAAIPYLRATAHGVTTEAPLENWNWVSFGELPA